MEAGLNASLELQRRETMGIRTKHFGASFEAGLEAGLEGLKAMEIGENNVTKKVPVLVLKTYEKAGAQKWASPVRRLAAISEAEKPVSFAIGNSWNDTLRADKRHHLEYTQRSQT